MKKTYVKNKDGSKRSVELDETLAFQPGVRRFRQKDGSGREDWYWVANMMIEGKQNARRWSCSRHGDKDAYELAIAQRLEWQNLKLRKMKEKASAKEKAAPKATARRNSNSKNTIKTESK